MRLVSGWSAFNAMSGSWDVGTWQFGIPEDVERRFMGFGFGLRGRWRKGFGCGMERDRRGFFAYLCEGERGCHLALLPKKGEDGDVSEGGGRECEDQTPSQIGIQTVDAFALFVAFGRQGHMQAYLIDVAVVHKLERIIGGSRISRGCGWHTMPTHERECILEVKHVQAK